MTTDRNDPKLKKIKADGQQQTHMVLPAEERAKGFVRPVRTSYKHLACNQVTTMGQTIAETYARDPKYYGGTYCSHCQNYFALILPGGDSKPAFVWDDGSGVGE